MVWFRVILLTCLLLISFGCSKRVIVDESRSDSNVVLTPAQAISLFKLSLDDAVQSKIAEYDLNISRQTLIAQYKTYLNKFSLYDRKEKSNYTLKTHLYSLRLRSYANAAFLGFKGGADFLTGTVTVVDENQKEVTQFDVSVSYAKGGLFSSASKRLLWLQKAFAQQVALKLAGKLDKN